jgi:cobaltochelatase CobS
MTTEMKNGMMTADQGIEMIKTVMHGINSYKGWNTARLNEIKGRLTEIESNGGAGGDASVDPEAIAAATKELVEFLNDKIAETQTALEQTVDNRVAEVAPREHFIVVKTGDVEDKIEGKAHSCLQKVLDVIAMGEIPMLVGPAGTGKTVLAKQVADILNVSFDGLSCSGGLTEAKIFGRSVPNIHTGDEKYNQTAYVKAYEAGGVFLFDEFDAADDNMMCSLNQSFDNGYMMLPERKDSPKAVRHEQSYIICTANTYGTGADRQYVSRNQMDAATMDRFTIIEVDYDAEIEAQVCPDQELLERFRGYRKAISENGLERIVSYRTLRKANKQRAIGWSDEEIDAQFFAGWHHDEVVMVRGSSL